MTFNDLFQYTMILISLAAFIVTVYSNKK